jgi:DNA polymerase
MAVDLVLALVVPHGETELVADRLWAGGATAVEERPASDGHVELVAGFPTAEAAQGAAAVLGGQVTEVDDRGWRDTWRRHASPVRAGSIVVAPAWRPVTVGGSELVVTIDPGPCFGSGSHPTTRLLLAELCKRVASGMTVLDVGTGSGILAVAAAALGAASVVAVDIDPEAVEATRRNAAANDLAGRIAVSVADAATVAGSFDVVVANLTAGALVDLAGVLVDAVVPGGVLLVSGMLSGQWQHVAGHLAALPVLEVLSLDGWSGAVLGAHLASPPAPRPPVASTTVPTLADVEQEARSCRRCPLSNGRTTVVFGEGSPTADLMVVGEGPGREEDLQGRPFVGRSGQLLDRLLLEELGVERSAVYIANVVKCRPPGNRDPLPEEIDACRPWLETQLDLIRPRVILTLGNFATRWLLGTAEGIRRLRGRVYPASRPGIVIVPTYHPAAALRGGGEVLAEMRADFVRAKEALSP